MTSIQKIDTYVGDTDGEVHYCSNNRLALQLKRAKLDRQGLYELSEIREVSAGTKDKYYSFQAILSCMHDDRENGHCINCGDVAEPEDLTDYWKD